MKFTMSQDAAHGALPTLRAATAMDAAPGSHYGPDRMFGLKGDPVLVPVPRLAMDEAVGRRLWEVSLGLTGVSFAGALGARSGRVSAFRRLASTVSAAATLAHTKMNAPDDVEIE